MNDHHRCPVGETPRLEGLSGHVVICNVNEKVGHIIDEIREGTGDDPPVVVVVVQDEALWEAHPEWRPSVADPERILFVPGCPAEVDDLVAVGAFESHVVVILADPRQGRLADAHSTLVAVAIERHNPHVHTVMELISSANRVHLRATEVNEVVCMGELTEKLIAQATITPGVERIFEHILSAHSSTTRVFLVPLPRELAGESYRAVASRWLDEGRDGVLVGYVQETPHVPTATRRTALQRIVKPKRVSGGGPPRRFVINPRAHVEPGKDTPLEAEDRLVVLSWDIPGAPTTSQASF